MKIKGINFYKNIEYSFSLLSFFEKGKFKPCHSNLSIISRFSQSQIEEKTYTNKNGGGV